MCKRSSPMNMKQLEGLLVKCKSHIGLWSDNAVELSDDLSRAIKYCQQRQASAHRRHAHFKFLADEQREMLR